MSKVGGGGWQDSPSVPVGRSPRTDKLLRAEEAVVGVGGCVVRLGGLYISTSMSLFSFLTWDCLLPDGGD